MNRRAAKARDRRKQSAALQRKASRLYAEAMKRVTAAIADAVSSQDTLAAAMRAGARALAAFVAETVATQAVRRMVAAHIACNPGPTCGTCGLTISPHPMTGTTCACAPRQFAWSPLLCTCMAEGHGDGDQCDYCAAYFAGQA